MKNKDNKTVLLLANKMELQASAYWKKDITGEDGDSVEDGGYSRVPYLYINGKKIDYFDITNFVIKQRGFLPTVSVTFTDNSNYFNAVNMIKDGDTMSVVLLSPGDTMKYKPVMCDFNIVSIKNLSARNLDSNDYVCEYRISGELKIQELKKRSSMSIVNKTSFDALKEICEKCGIGFASNIEQTSDKQTWINCNDTIETFVQNIAAHSYLDDTSFFKCFIDLNYNLNFVELDRMFTQVKKNEFKKDVVVYYANFSSNEYTVEKEGGEHKKESINMLTNNTNNIGYNNYILKFSISTNNDVSKTYRKYTRYWDFTAKGFVDEFVEGQNHQTDGMIAVNKGQIINDENWSLEHLYSFIDYSISDNTNIHENYYFAETNNLLNLEESHNYKADVVLEANCMNILNYSTIWVDYYDKSTLNVDSQKTFLNDNGEEDDGEEDSQKRLKSDIQEKEKETNTEENTDTDVMVYNNGLSGCYVVCGFDYVFEGEGFRQHVSLIRRETEPNIKYYNAKK